MVDFQLSVRRTQLMRLLRGLTVPDVFLSSGMNDMLSAMTVVMDESGASLPNNAKVALLMKKCDSLLTTSILQDYLKDSGKAKVAAEGFDSLTGDAEEEPSASSDAR
jgi:hypothetical protein